MSANLATILTETAERFGDRIAMKLDDLELNYALLDEASARIAGELKAARPAARRPRRDHAAERPVLPGRLLRRPAGRRRRRADERAAQGRARSAFYLEDPGAKLLFAWHGFGEAAHGGAEQAGAEVIDVKPGEFEQLVGAPSRTATWPTSRRTTPR